MSKDAEVRSRKMLVEHLRREARMLITDTGTSKLLTKAADLLERDHEAVTMFEEVRAEREDKLRQLLSYCRERGERNGGSAEQMGDARAHRSIANRLIELLDGEQ